MHTCNFFFDQRNLKSESMVSFHESISSNQKKISNQDFFENSSEKKRRWGDRDQEEENSEKESNKKQSKGGVVENATKSLMGIDFHLETPSSFEDWKQCLDIQSGEVHFYNTRNQKITYKDPRQQLQTDEEKLNSSNHHMSLELELNLPCESLRTHHMDNNNNWSSTTKCDFDATKKNSNKGFEISKLQSFNSSVKRCPSWMSFEADQQEMVAAACMRCHMLVMLCKSSPSCPNCKFMHPPDHHQSPSNLFKPRRFSPLHCKD